METLGLTHNQEELDGNGKIDFDKFVQIMLRKAHEPAEEVEGASEAPNSGPAPGHVKTSALEHGRRFGGGVNLEPGQTLCWGCGEVENETRFKRCVKCLEQSRLLVPAKFCSDECYKTSWPRHKKWHKDQLSELEKFKPPPVRPDEQVAATKTEASHSDYNALVKASEDLMALRDSRKAAKKYEKAIKVDPERPEAYFGLASFEVLQPLVVHLPSSLKSCSPSSFLHSFWPPKSLN